MKIPLVLKRNPHSYKSGDVDTHTSSIWIFFVDLQPNMRMLSKFITFLKILKDYPIPIPNATLG